MSDKLREALRQCASCLEDVASGKGGWAWEEVLNESHAALATPDWLPIPRDVDTTRAPFDGGDYLIAWDAPTPKYRARGMARFDLLYGWLSWFGDWIKNPTLYCIVPALPAPPTENDDAQ